MKIITIGREYGSGGSTIGKMVAKELGIPYYSRAVIDEAARQSGMAVEAIKENDQVVTRNFLFDLAVGPGYGYTTAGMPLDITTKVFLAQREAILKFAVEPCVIVGRCADYILKDRADIFKVFIYADKEARKERAISQYGVPADKAEKMVSLSDKHRSRHYEEFTDQIWGARQNYDLMINSTTTGYENAAKIIAELAK